jgi:hypothetical protein
MQIGGKAVLPGSRRALLLRLDLPFVNVVSGGRGKGRQP